MHSPDSCEKTASHTPVSIQEKKCSRNLIVTRACAHDSPTSTSWSGGYARRRRARGHGFEPHRAHWNLLGVAAIEDEAYKVSSRPCQIGKWRAHPLRLHQPHHTSSCSAQGPTAKGGGGPPTRGRRRVSLRDVNKNKTKDSLSELSGEM